MRSNEFYSVIDLVPRSTVSSKVTIHCTVTESIIVGNFSKLIGPIFVVHFIVSWHLFSFSWRAGVLGGSRSIYLLLFLILSVR